MLWKVSGGRKAILLFFIITAIIINGCFEQNEKFDGTLNIEIKNNSDYNNVSIEVIDSNDNIYYNNITNISFSINIVIPIEYGIYFINVSTYDSLNNAYLFNVSTLQIKETTTNDIYLFVIYDWKIVIAGYPIS